MEPLEARTQLLFDLLDAKEFGRLQELLATDAQGVDEISGGWMRGSAAIADYFREAGATIEAIQSTLGDLRVTAWGDAGLVTFDLDQAYALEGAPQHVRAPTSIVFRREGEDWMVVLVHSVPLPS